MEDSLSQDEDWQEEEPQIADLMFPEDPAKMHDNLNALNEFYSKNHNFDILALANQTKVKTNPLSQIKLINYIRKNSKNDTFENIKSNILLHKFDDEINLIPTIKDDQLLIAFQDHYFDDDESSNPPTLQKLNLKDPKPTENLPESNDDYYFESYSNYDIHREMLSDTVRNKAYDKALETCKGKTIMDVGCGTGFLSLLALKHGAAFVVAMDNAEIIHTVTHAARENGLDLEKICVLKGKVEDFDSLAVVHKPEGFDLASFCPDVIVSEWMGYGLFFENMFESVKHVHQRFPSAQLIPSKGAMYLHFLNSFNNLCGLKFDFLKAEDPVIRFTQVNEDERFFLKECDFQNMSSKDIDFVAELNYVAKTPFDTIALSFDCHMVENKSIILNTAERTHWGHTLFEIPLQPSGAKKISMKYTRNNKNPREVDVLLTINGSSFAFRIK